MTATATYQGSRPYDLPLSVAGEEGGRASASDDTFWVVPTWPTASTGIFATVTEPFEEQYVELDDAHLWTFRQGAGPALVLLHGGPGGDFRPLRPLVYMLGDLVEVFGYDQRGGGRSTRSPPFTVDRWVADLEGLRAHWGLESWTVAGHSFGAAVALAYASTHPERLRGLIHMSCLPAAVPGYKRASTEYRNHRLANLSPELRGRYEALLQRREQVAGKELHEVRREMAQLTIEAEFADPKVAATVLPQLVEDLERTNWEVNRHLGEDHERYACDGRLAPLSWLRAPVLLLHGDHDPRPMWAVEQLADLLPNATLVRIEGAGHLPWLERQHLVRSALRTFVTSIS